MASHYQQTLEALALDSRKAIEDVLVVWSAEAVLCARLMRPRSPRKAVEYTALETLREAGRPYRQGDAIWSAVASEARHRFG